MEWWSTLRRNERHSVLHKVSGKLRSNFKAFWTKLLKSSKRLQNIFLLIKKHTIYYYLRFEVSMFESASFMVLGGIYLIASLHPKDIYFEDINVRCSKFFSIRWAFLLAMNSLLKIFSIICMHCLAFQWKRNCLSRSSSARAIKTDHQSP